MLSSKNNEIVITVWRGDEIHPYVSGNKWYKLKYNLLAAKHQQAKGILTFGGAYSNHLLATAVAAQAMGLPSVGVVRGEKPGVLSPTLKNCLNHHMHLKFIPRSLFKKRSDSLFQEELIAEFDHPYLIPEGGTNNAAIRGVSEMAKELCQRFRFDVIICPVGTGGTIAGLICGLKREKVVLGFPVLKNPQLRTEIESLVGGYDNPPARKEQPKWELVHDYHFGGYAKHTTELLDFVNQFTVDQGIRTDPVYTGKMMFGLAKMLDQGRFYSGTRILVLHTGGLQGIAGFNARFGELINDD